MEQVKNKIMIKLDEKLIEGIEKIIKTYLPPTHNAFIFGSWADGSARERSDIDIGIDGPTKLDTDKYHAILVSLENLPTLLKFDLVDFADVSKEFKTQSYQHVIKLNNNV